MFITTLDNVRRDVDWPELNQLKKDILWIFDFNTKDLVSAFVPELSFTSKYWEFLTLNTEESLSLEDEQFYQQGVLIIILCMTIEYVDTTSGNQQVFGSTPVQVVKSYVEAFEPKNQSQEKLKTLVVSGLDIAATMTPQDLINTDGYNHQDLSSFYSQLNWVDDTFIKSYFSSKAS
jgi:hypothetical protein